MPILNHLSYITLNKHLTEESGSKFKVRWNAVKHSWEAWTFLAPAGQFKWFLVSESDKNFYISSFHAELVEDAPAPISRDTPVTELDIDTIPFAEDSTLLKEAKRHLRECLREYAMASITLDRIKEYRILSEAENARNLVREQRMRDIENS